MIEYKDTSSKELRLAFAKKDLDVTALDVIDKKEMGKFEFGILGASHYIKLKKEGIPVLTEVFSCAEFSSNDTSIVHVRDTIKSELKQLYSGILYKFESRVEEYDPSIYSHYMQLYESNTNNGLLFEFPYEGNPSFTPVTMVAYDKFKTKHFFDTMHAYPEENKLVITKTIIIDETL